MPWMTTGVEIIKPDPSMAPGIPGEGVCHFACHVAAQFVRGFVFGDESEQFVQHTERCSVVNTTQQVAGHADYSREVHDIRVSILKIRSFRLGRHAGNVAKVVHDGLDENW